jgi:hypothetical protein
MGILLPHGICYTLCPGRNFAFKFGSRLSVLVLGSIGIMVTPGGIGLYPVLVAETLTLYGIAADSGIGLAMGWITWSAQTFMILAIGGAALFIISFRPKKKIDES